MRIVNMHEAKTHLSKLVHAVIHGKEVTIAMAGKPVVKLVPVEKKKKRPIGLLKGKIKVSKGFYDELPEEIIAAFEGDS